MSTCGFFSQLLYKEQGRCFLNFKETSAVFPFFFLQGSKEMFCWLQTDTCKYEHFTSVNPH